MSETLLQVSGFLDHVFTFGPWLVYLVIFIACFVENLFPPFPGDTFMVVGGALVAAERLELWVVWPVMIIGGMSSVMLLYRFGRRRGRDFFLRKNYKAFSAKDIEAVEKRLARNGALVMLFSRFVVGIRAALAVAAGIGRYPVAATLIYSTISYIIFSGLLVFAAIKLVENLGEIEYYVTTYNRIAYPIVIVLVIAVIVYKLVSYRRRKAGEDSSPDRR